MNGAVYISFFQGQLESVLEQVVQLAVQEISKSVGSSLNALLLETAVKEQENRRLRLQLQAQARDRERVEERGPAAAARTRAGDERGGAQPGGPHTDTRRLEQRGRVVDQLKSVMQQVLDFAVRELTKIVEASFDNLLLEVGKMEKEHEGLQERLGRGCGRAGGGGRRKGSENDSASPSGSEDAREEPAEPPKEPAPPDGPEDPPVLAASQDWVPILDKVFGQKWCGDAWQGKQPGGGGAGRSLSEGAGHRAEPLSTPAVILEPRPSSPQQDPRWTPLEDMEVFSPDEEEEAAQRSSSAPGHAPPPPASPTGGCPPASMLHRLLTLPSQLLEDEDDGAAKDALVSLTANGGGEPRDDVTPAAPPNAEEEEEEEEEGEEEDKGRKKRRRVWSECEECGRRFSRMSLLKAHRQTHAAGDGAGGDADAPPSPQSPAGAGAGALPLCCSRCGKRFSSATRLQSHARTQHPPENRS
ncbi:Krueppel-like factor 2 isoform X2 [Cololabis saira]|uniref:Krueppel-like factor 2 isoform X2 n=1 Tax=Cololabis saira TaxID=129043 RepID=UPI002AD4F965|nr:Krueppel-like factor 2 isoform X2 [Cololabis saira]